MAQNATVQGERSQLPPEDTEMGRALRQVAPLPAPAGEQQVEYLWPENVTAWRCWQEMQTQWRVGVAGATGLDYAGVVAYIDEQQRCRRLRRRDRASVWDGVRACEAAVLAVWSQQRKTQQQQQAPQKG